MDYKLTNVVYKGNNSDIKKSVANVMAKRVNKGELVFSKPTECAEYVAAFYEELPWGMYEAYNFSCDGWKGNEFYVTGYYWSENANPDGADADVVVEFTFNVIPSRGEFSIFERAFN